MPALGLRTLLLGLPSYSGLPPGPQATDVDLVHAGRGLALGVLASR